MKNPRQNSHLDAFNEELQRCFSDILIYPCLSDRNTYIRGLLDRLYFEFEENVSKVSRLLKNVVEIPNTDSSKHTGSTLIGKTLKRLFQRLAVTVGLLPKWWVVPIFVDIFCRKYGCAPPKSQRYFSPSLNIIPTYI